MKYFKNTDRGYIVSVSENYGEEIVTDAEFEELKSMISKAPLSPNGYTYKLRADTLEWELVELPPVEPEPLTDEEALTRYANTLTGANDQTLVEAAETLITEKIKEE